MTKGRPTTKLTPKNRCQDDWMIKPFVLRVKSALASLLSAPTIGAIASAIFGYSIPSSGIRIFTGGKSFDNRVRARIICRTYESAEIRLIRRYLKSCELVVELGSSLGITGAHALSVMSEKGSLICVEANASLIPSLSATLQHAALPTQSFRIEPVAIAYGKEYVHFDFSGSNIFGRLLEDKGSQEDHVLVNASTLTEIVGRIGEGGRSALVCDIEGAEYDLFENELELVSAFDVIVIEVHERSDRSLTVSEMAEFVSSRLASRSCWYSYQDGNVHSYVRRPADTQETLERAIS